LPWRCSTTSSPTPRSTPPGAAREFARRFSPNGIIGLGGGSPLDIAKATAAILANETPLDQMWGVGKSENRRSR